MPYSLFLSRTTNRDRAFGDNLYLSNLPYDSEVFVFYYPSMHGDDVLKTRLRKFGRETGKDIFVNIGKIGDKDYKRIVNHFEITRLPVIIITGKNTIASLRTTDGLNELTAYIKLDNKYLFEDVDKIMESMGEIFNLFISRRIANALHRSKELSRNANLRHIKDTIIDNLKVIKEIDVGLLTGGFSIKFTGE